MILKPNSALLQIPEFLLQEKSDADSLKELLEQLNPNSVNTSAALVDKIMSELPPMNNWVEMDDYIKEFKLDEIFEGLDKDFYAVKQSELLKGFFTFKGTELDLAYIMRIAGYTLKIYDADYYRRGLSFHSILMDHFPGIFDDLLNKMDPDTLNKFFQSYLLLLQQIHLVNNNDPLLLNNLADLKVVNESEELRGNILTGLRSEVQSVDNVNPIALDNLADMMVINVGSDYVNNVIHIVNNLTPLEVDNLAGLKVVNEDSDNQSLLSYGIDLTTDQVEKLLQGLTLWRQFIDEYGGSEGDDLDCTLTSELYIDMDSEKFMKRGFKASEVLQDIRQLLEFRLSVCAYVRAIKATLETKDFFERSHLDEATESTIDIETFEVAPEPSDTEIKTEVSFAHADRMEIHMFAPRIFDTLDVGAHVTLIVDNVDPYRVPGRNEYYTHTTDNILKIDNVDPIKVNNVNVYEIPGTVVTFASLLPYVGTEQVGAHVTMRIDNQNPYRVPGTAWSYQDSIPYIERIGAHVTMKVDNVNPYRVPGTESFFLFNYDNEYPPGIHHGLKVDNVKGFRLVGAKEQFQEVILEEFKFEQEFGFVETYAPWIVDALQMDAEIDKETFDEVPEPEEATQQLIDSDLIDSVIINRALIVNNSVPLILDNVNPLILVSDNSDPLHTVIDIEFRDNLWLLDVAESDLESEADQSESIDEVATPEEDTLSEVDNEFVESVTLNVALLVNNVTPLKLDNVTPLVLVDSEADLLESQILITMQDELQRNRIDETDVTIVPSDPEAEDAPVPEDASESRLDVEMVDTYTIDGVTEQTLEGEIEVLAAAKVDGNLKVGGNGITYKDRPQALTGIVPPNSSMTSHTLSGFI